jgi:plasmid stability protein
MEPYREQFERVRRFLNRVRNEGRDSVDYDDDLWAFFQNSWHLKDWIKHDSSISEESRKRILRAAEASEDLKICADLANRSKHFELKNKRRGAKVTSRNMKVFPGANRPSESTHIITLDDGSQLVAQELAERVIVVWGEILAKEGLQ